jgi:putative glutamine amidotransferase
VPDLNARPTEAPRPVLLVVDVADGGRDDPAFEAELQKLTASVLTAATGVGFVVDRVPAAQTDPGDLARRLDAADAVVLTGGEDVDPSFYGGRTDEPHLGQTFPDADRAQIAVVRRAVAARVPLVGICRGMQLVNVALGGDLVQHLHDGGHVNAVDPADSMVDHRVDVDADSDLARLLGATSLDVRSSHHQAVNRPGESLRVVARAFDGTVEAIEHESAPLWCVQWHPEDAGSRGTVLTDLLQAALAARRPEPHTLSSSPIEGSPVSTHDEHSPQEHIPGPGESSVPELEVDETIPPRPEEEIANVLRAEPDVEDHSQRSE